MGNWFDDPWEETFGEDTAGGGVIDWAQENPIAVLGTLTGLVGPQDPLATATTIFGNKLFKEKVAPMISGRTEGQLLAAESQLNATNATNDQLYRQKQALVEDFYSNLSNSRKQRGARLNAMSGMVDDDSLNRVLQSTGGGGFR
jgi:hypothetical protein